jgi:glycosyltransferase involved in cell wall biosynthesis
MNILHVLGDCTLPRRPDEEAASGLVRAVLEIARAQISRGHAVTVAVAGAEAWRSEWAGVCLLGLASAPWARGTIAMRALDFRQHLPYVLLTRRHTFDVVHGHLYSYLRFLRAKQRVAHFHGDPFWKGRDYEDLALRPTDFLTIGRHSQAQVAVSHFVAGKLRQGLDDHGNVHVVHNGVDWARFTPDCWEDERLQLRRAWGVPEDGVVFLFAGAIVPEKGVIHLARAFARLAAALPGAHLTLAGTSGLWGGPLSRNELQDEYEIEVQRALAGPLAEGRVHLLGKVAAARMAAVYRAADAVVVPSVWEEAFGLVALEALASERPVIATGTGGLVEAVSEHNSILVPPGDEAAIEAAMRALAESAALRERLVRGARAHVRRFSWDEAARRLDDIYVCER